MKIWDEPTMRLRLVTYNIRYATKDRSPHEEPWSIRCPKLASQLNFVTAGQDSSFICLQEALYKQLQDVREKLGPSWDYIGEGRDGGRGGEFSPVFYRPDTWKCEKSRTLWLSKTPEVPSRGWDAALNRIVTVGEFMHRELGIKVVVMSTHFDHMGTKAREESAKLLLRFAREWGCATLDHPRPKAVLLGGDFNSTPDDAGYKIMTAPTSGMVDVRERVPPEMRYGNELTYTSFGDGDGPAQRIDFLFVTRESQVEIQTYGVLANRFDDGIYISDHRPVVADMEF